MSKTNYLENAIVNHVLRNTAYTSPTSVHIGLFTAAPGEAGGGTEVSGNAYARQAVTFGAPTDGVCLNTALVQFPIATPSGWGTVTHFAIFDAATGGNMLYHAALGASLVVNASTRVEFAIGQISVGEQ